MKISPSVPLPNADAIVSMGQVHRVLSERRAFATELQSGHRTVELTSFLEAKISQTCEIKDTF